MSIAELVFFGVYGINFFFPFVYAGFILAVAAIIIAICIIVAYARTHPVA